MQDSLKYLYDTVVLLLKHNATSVIASYIDSNCISDFIYNHDNWNGGRDFYVIEVHIAIDEFVALKQANQKEVAEKEIAEAFNDVIGDDESIQISNVCIKPANKISRAQHPNDNDVTFWRKDYYRVFISHVSKYKRSAANLKIALEPYGITGFVAHEDIQPSREWCNEIMNALFSMHALCAIITDDFIESEYCDQETGVAIGRNVLCIPIAKGRMPYGFWANYQAIKAPSQVDATEIAKKVVEAICSQQTSRMEYFRCLTSIILHVANEKDALKWLDVLNGLENLNANDVSGIHGHYLENDILCKHKIMKEYNKVFEHVGLSPIAPPAKPENLSSDDLPF